jgi:Flp pilus assembly protein TadG
MLLPLLLLLIANVVNFGGFFYAWISVSNAARAGADYVIMGSATVNGPEAPPIAWVQSLVTNDLSTLPNSASGLTVVVCTNNNVAAFACGGGTLSKDPEAPLYESAMVDVTYTYLPFIPLWNLPFGINTTIPPTKVHSAALMRMEI